MFIGNIEVKNPLFLAPMAGVTDWAYRTVCAQHGAGVTVTEMVSSRALVYKDKKSAKLLRKMREASAVLRFSVMTRKLWQKAPDLRWRFPVVILLISIWVALCPKSHRMVTAAV